MFNIRHIDTALLTAFDALYDERSVTRAAQRLALTQPTVSSKLNRLRDLFGDPLFIRTRHGILPTPRAEALAEPVKALLADAEALLAPEEFVPAQTDETFTFMGHDYLRYLMVPPLAAALRRAAPRSRLAVMPPYVDDLAEKLANGKLDLAVTVARHVPPKVRTRLLFRDPHVGVVSRSYPLGTDKPDLETFCDLNHALVSPGGGSFDGPTDSALAELGHTRRVVASFPNYKLLLESLAELDIAVVVPASLGRRYGREYRIFKLPVTVPDLEVIACWHPRVDKGQAEIWFRELVFGVAAEFEPEGAAS